MIYRYLFLLIFGLGGLPIAPLFAAETLERAVSSRMERVNEFRFIREQAEKMGVRVWLFGGTAAGYGHYVKWDLAREAGDKRFQPDRFDYDYTNIFRSTQDLDIVIDGSPEQVQAMQSLLEEKFQHFQGKRTAWEVRSLSQKVRDKEPLLDNPDFLNQHTDSNSTGMIEITEPKNNEPVIRDLRDWKNPNPAFLTDLKTDKLHFYFSPNHFSTNRARDGLNPPILSVLRYFTKAFQYELEIDPESLKHLKKIIADFDPEKDLADSYAAEQFEKNGKKIIQHAVNLEYAKNTLDKLGLRKKLVDLGDPTDEETLAWWMNRKPLMSKEVGLGKGPTAAELAKEKGWPLGPNGEIIVAHETNNYLAYESITRAHTGDPNVLTSREGFSGEAAAYGEGFYTKLGRTGARDTGLTIRFVLDPNARLGTDFTLNGNDGDYVILQNKKATRVIPESLNFSPGAYFHFLAQAEGLDDSDKALMEKLGRRVRARFGLLNESELAEIREVVEKEFKKNGLKNKGLFSEWFRIPGSVEKSKNLLRKIEKDPKSKMWSLALMEEFPHWKNSDFQANLTLEQAMRGFSGIRFEYNWDNKFKGLMTRFSDLSKLDPADVARAKAFLLEYLKGDIGNALLDMPISRWLEFPWVFDPTAMEVPLAMTKNKDVLGELFKEILKRGRVDILRDHPEILMSDQKYALAIAVRDTKDQLTFETLEYLLDHAPNNTADDRIAEVLVSKELSNHPRWGEAVSKLVKRKGADRAIADRIGRIPAAAAHPEWVDSLIRRHKADSELVMGLLREPKIWKPNPKWMTKLLQSTRDFRNHDLDSQFVTALKMPEWRAFSEWRSWVQELHKNKVPTSSAYQFFLPEDIDPLVKRKNEYVDRRVAEFLMAAHQAQDPSSPTEFKKRSWVKTRLNRIVNRGLADFKVVSEIAERPEWRNETDWIEKIVKRGNADLTVVTELLKLDEFANRTDWLIEILKHGMEKNDVKELDDAINELLKSKPSLVEQLKEMHLTDGKDVSAASLRAKVLGENNADSLFMRAVELYKGYKWDGWRGKMLDGFNNEQLAIMAQTVIDDAHHQADTFEAIRGHAQRQLAMRNDPRVPGWVAEDLKRLRGQGQRLEWLRGARTQNPAVEKVVLDFWKEIHPADTKDKSSLRYSFVRELTEGADPDLHVGETVKLNKSFLPIALDAIETVGEENHTLRYFGMMALDGIDLDQDPRLRSVLIGILEKPMDANDAIRTEAMKHMARAGENSPEYFAKVKAIADSGKVNFQAKRQLEAELERLGNGANCGASFGEFRP